MARLFRILRVPAIGMGLWLVPAGDAAAMCGGNVLATCKARPVATAKASPAKAAPTKARPAARRRALATPPALRP